MKTTKLLKNKRIRFIAVCFSAFLAHEQGIAQNIGINTTGALPAASALLDVDAAPGNNKGVLITRIALLSTTDVVTIPSPATSLLVYNTNAAMTGGSLGFWYFDGTKWVGLQNSSSTSGTTNGPCYTCDGF